MLALISDIHANREALEAVLQEIRRLRCERIYCLGDLVGYGPDPVWCVDTVLETCDVVLAGNHDQALIYGRRGFTEMAETAISYHRKLLAPSRRLPGDDERRPARWQALKSLPHRHVEDGRLFVHASPRNPINEYLRAGDARLGLEQKLTANFALVQWLAFVGHTHKPGVITASFEFLTPDACGGLYRAMPGRKAIINAVSVGQPRDGDPTACFVTVDETDVRWHRVAYDLEVTVEKIHAAGALDYRFAERLKTAV